MPDRSGSDETGSGHVAAVWTAILVTVLWSSSWILIRIGLDDEQLEPITFAGLRYALAAVVLVAVVGGSPARRADAATLDRGSIGRLALLGVVFYALTQGAQFVAIDNQPAATTSLVLSLTPLIVALAATHSLGERATGRQVGGAALVAVGAWIYFGGELGATTVGMAAAVTGLLANVASSLIGRSVNRGRTHSPIVVTTVSMAIGSSLLLATGVVVEGVPTLSAKAILILLWLAIVNSALAATLWNRSLVRLSALESAGINNTMLVQIAALAWIFLGEAPGIAGLIGILVVTAGILLTQVASLAMLVSRPPPPGSPQRRSATSDRARRGLP